MIERPGLARQAGGECLKYGIHNTDTPCYSVA